MKTQFKFYKENRTSQGFTMELSELKAKYREYLQSKEPSWVLYYGHQTVVAFVTSKDGLNSTPEEQEDLRKLEDALMEIRHELPIYQK